MKTTNRFSESLKSGFVVVIIPVELAIAYCIYFFVLGDPGNFQGGDPANHPLEGNVAGLIYKGGVLIVPILIALLMLVLTFFFERWLTITRAKGRGNLNKFVNRIRHLVSNGNIQEAIAECDKQRGSVANVVKAGLSKYAALSLDTALDKEQKILMIQKDLEETTQLEMPMLEKNLVIIATIASIATLVGLLGTVFGMINAFAALATAGAPDAVGLANGISEALINTALGIATSALAIVFYNYFTSTIDTLTYGIDEAGYSIVQNFSAQAKA